MSRPVSSRKPRASSQLRIAAILDAARSLLAEQGVGGLSVYSVAERAQMPPSSVYHFFASVPAILEALDPASLRDWRDLARVVEQRMLAIYAADPAACQLILAQHGLTEVTQADRLHDIELGELMQALFNQHFQLPSLPDDVDVFALAMELGDRVYARSVQQPGL
ncbi:MAG: TetR family transcriptional regulator, partial [Pseudomonas sp. PGPPP3]